MRNSLLRLTVAVITFAIGIATGSVWSSLQSSVATDGPCREGLVTVAHQPDAPIGISILSVNCADGFVYTNYKVEGRTNRLIKSLEIRRNSAHHGIVDFDSHGDSSISVVDGGMTACDLKHHGTGEGIKLSRGWFRDPVDEVRYSVRSVTFTDGSVWSSASENE